MKKEFLLLSIVALCITAAPATAELSLPITVNNPQAVWTYGSNTLTFSATSMTTTGIADTAILFWWTAPSSFSMTMHLDSSSNNGTSVYVDDGAFTLTDLDGQSIVGDFTGMWIRSPVENKNQFTGTTTDVHFMGTSTTFNGDFGTSATIPLNVLFSGLIDAQTGTAPWFGLTDWTQLKGSTVGVTASAVPIPEAVLLGFLGLGAAGLGLRRLA